MDVKEALARKADETKGEVKLSKDMSIADMIRAMQPEIKKALPEIITVERFTRMALSALNTTPKLRECTPISFIAAMMNAAQLGLEPNTPLGQAYLIPFKNKGVMECQFQIGYKGLIDLAYRSGEIKVIQAHTVYENDEFAYELGLEPKLHHVPARANRGAPAYFYAVFHTKDGGYGFEVTSYEDVENHAKRYSKAYGGGPWQTNFEEMAKKTLIKQVLKYAPIKADFRKALTTDETVKTSIAPDMGDLRDETVWDTADYEEVA